MKLLPVSVTEEIELRKPEPSQVEPARCGAIHIELPGKVRISSKATLIQRVVRAVLKSLRS